MAQSGKGKLNYRCPSLLCGPGPRYVFTTRTKKEYYCLRCQYRGTEEDVLAKNQMARFRYGDMMTRFTEEDFENF